MSSKKQRKHKRKREKAVEERRLLSQQQTKLHPLEDRSPSRLPCFTKATAYKLKNGLILVVALGLGTAATFLFKEGSEKYGNSPASAWMTDIFKIPEGARGDITWVCSGLEYLALVGLATFSMEDHVDYVLTQESLVAKFVKGGAILLFSSIQATQVPAVTFATGGNKTDIILAGVGATPVAFLASRMIIKQIQWAIEYTDKLWLKLCAFVPDRVYSSRGTQIRLIRKQFHDTKQTLVGRLKAGQLLNYAKGTVPEGKTTIELWGAITQHLDINTDYTESWLHTFIKFGLKATSSAFGTYPYGDAVVRNMIFNVIPKILPDAPDWLQWTNNKPGEITIGSSLSPFAIALFNTVLWNGIDAVYDSTINTKKYHVIDPIAYQTFKLTTILLTTAFLLAAPFSFATGLGLFNLEYDGPEKSYEAIIFSIVLAIFHAFGGGKFLSEATKKWILITSTPNNENFKKVLVDNAVKAAEVTPPLQVAHELDKEENLDQLLGQEEAQRFKHSVAAAKTMNIFNEAHQQKINEEIEEDLENGKEEQSDEGSDYDA